MLSVITYRDLQSEQNAGRIHREVGMLQGKKATMHREGKQDRLLNAKREHINQGFL